MKPVNFTMQERNVLQLMAKGNTVIKIAEQLGIATSTVNSYRTRISYKLLGAGIPVKDFRKKTAVCF